MQGRKAGTPAGRSLIISLSSMYAYIYCLLVSNTLTSLPIFGGALFMCFQVASDFFTTCMGSASRILPAGIRKVRVSVLILLLLMNLFLIVIYPMTYPSEHVWLVMAVVLAMQVRDMLAKRVIRQRASNRIRETWFIIFLAVLHLVPALLILAVFLSNLSMSTALLLLAGYGIEDALALYIHLKDLDYLRAEPQQITQELSELLHERLEKNYAFRTYEALSLAVVVGLTGTTVLMYTYIAVSAQEMMLQMTTAFAVTFIAREVVDWILKRRSRRAGAHVNPTYVMLAGLFLVLYGLVIFYNAIRATRLNMDVLYTCLGICSAGSTLCITCLGWMEETMMNVARFSLKNETSGYRIIRSNQLQLGLLLGQMGALCALAAVCYMERRQRLGQMPDLAFSLQPLLVLPALVVIATGIICTLRFPLSRRLMDKLNRYLHLQEEGRENPALKSQLKHVVADKNRQPFGTSLLKACIRLLWHHRLVGLDQVHLDEENPVVFLCNHGQFYGPVICASHIRMPIRPWVMATLCINDAETVDYNYRYTIRERTWIPERLKMPVARLVSRICAWCMHQLEAIPVYRDSPGQLIGTFRQSVEAMQSGDNLLIFPENPNAIAQDRGYESDGLGPVFEGFAMLAPIYYRRTGKSLRFIPMYAHKYSRTLSFGEEVDYNPEAGDEQAERLRVVHACEQEMLRLMNEQNALLAARKQHGKKK